MIYLPILLSALVVSSAQNDFIDSENNSVVMDNEIKTLTRDTDDRSEFDPGTPLILTNLINSGKIIEAQNLARVHNVSDLVSYSAFFTVDPKYNSNLFFWFFPAAFNPEKAPLLLWINGGPGSTSMLGLFVENGPFRLDNELNLQLRKTSWALTHSVIYIDSPVGAGFSFTDDDAGYAKVEEDVSKGLYSALIQFFTLFPQYQTRDFYLTGESYAGKYIPILAWKIHTENNGNPKVKINLKGMAIGDPYSDPESTLEMSGYLHYVGLIDQYQKIQYQAAEEKIKKYIHEKNWTAAFDANEKLFFGPPSGPPSLFKNFTGFDFFYNIILDSEPREFGLHKFYFQLPYVRRSLHVGNVTFENKSSKVRLHMKEVVLQSAVQWIALLLDAKEKYQLLIYNGQLDICVANIFTENFLTKLQWHGAEDFLKSERKFWKVGKDLAGYVKVTDNLTYLVIRNSGHIVPYDQPKWSFDMINRFTTAKHFAK